MLEKNPLVSIPYSTYTPVVVQGARKSIFTNRVQYSINNPELQSSNETKIIQISKKWQLSSKKVPWQVDGLRSIQHGGVYGPIAKWYRNNVALTIGLFCSEAFVYEGIVDLTKQLGIGIDAIKYFNIKGRVIIRTEDKEYEFPLKDFRKYARPACEFCKDYSAELADVGLGGIGLDNDRNTNCRRSEIR